MRCAERKGGWEQKLGTNPDVSAELKEGEDTLKSPKSWTVHPPQEGRPRVCTLGPRADSESTIDKACAELYYYYACVAWMHATFSMLITVAFATLVGVGVFAVVFHFMQILL